MARLSKHHTELTDGVGRCSVPMWILGVPAGFCDEPAYGEQTAEYLEGMWGRPVYAEGLADRITGAARFLAGRVDRPVRAVDGLIDIARTGR